MENKSLELPTLVLKPKWQKSKSPSRTKNMHRTSPWGHLNSIIINFPENNHQTYFIKFQ